MIAWYEMPLHYDIHEAKSLEIGDVLKKLYAAGECKSCGKIQDIVFQNYFANPDCDNLAQSHH